MASAAIVAARAVNRPGNRTQSMRQPQASRISSVRNNSIRQQLAADLLLINDDNQEQAVKDVTKNAVFDSNMDNISKLDSGANWRTTRVVITGDTLYFLSRKVPQILRYEIMDYVTLHDIVHICDMSRTGFEVLNRLESSPRNFPEVRQQNPILLAGFTLAARNNFENVISSPEFSSALEIHTSMEGVHSGRIYYISPGSEEERRNLGEHLRKGTEYARQVFHRRHRIKWFQENAHQIYSSRIFQSFVVCAITANFIVSLMQAQIGDGTQTCTYDSISNQSLSSAYSQAQNLQSTFDKLDLSFTILFVAELTINFCAHAVKPFFKNRHNWFDTIVVLISVAMLFVSTTSNGLVKQLRILRVFRVLRVFGRIGQLREIVSAVSVAIVPALQALFIGLIVVAIYATVGTQYFGQENPQRFCDFYHSMYTMFGVIAYSQDDGIQAFDSNGNVRFGPVAFIYSFVAIVMFVLLQVVVAVLLDSFFREREKGKEEQAKEEAAKERLASQHTHPMEPVLERISCTFDTAQNLNDRLDLLFKKLDSDKKGGLSFSELRDGLHKFTSSLDEPNSARLTIEEFEAMTDRGRLCNEDNEMNAPQFRDAMTKQLRVHVQRSMADALYNPTIGADMTSLVASMKLVMIELHDVQQDVVGLRAGMREQLSEVKQMLAEILQKQRPSA